MDTPTPSCFAPRYEVGKRYAQWLHIPLQPQSGHWIVGRLTEVKDSGWYTLESEDHTVVTGLDVCGLCPVDEMPGIRERDEARVCLKQAADFYSCAMDRSLPDWKVCTCRQCRKWRKAAGMEG